MSPAEDARPAGGDPAPRPPRPEPPTPGPDDLVVTPRVVVPVAALTFSFAGSSGPGGQNVNKRATKCILRVSLAELPLRADQLERLAANGSRYLTEAGELVIPSDEHRTAPRNKAECLEKLRTLIAQSLVAPKKRKPTKPSKRAKQRRLDEKKKRGEIKKRRRGEE